MYVELDERRPIKTTLRTTHTGVITTVEAIDVPRVFVVVVCRAVDGWGQTSRVRSSWGRGARPDPTRESLENLLTRPGR